MAERSHLSIGEVLSLLQDEFPDVTISKIRFLESQGLLDPERTPSGYRKFYEADVRRLRWILTEQRDRFLPLKVIKDRLQAGDVDAELAAPDPSGNGAAAAVPPAGATAEPAADDPPGPPPAPSVDVGKAPEAAEALAAQDAGAATVPDAAPAPAPAPTSAPVPEAATAPAPEPEPEPANLPIWMADAARAKVDRGRGGRTDVGDGPDPLAGDPTTVSLTADELLAASGLTRAQLASLEEYGLLGGHSVGDDRYYGGDDLVVAQKAVGFLTHGLEARHLRMFKNAADREAALLEQLVLPLMKQRSPGSREEAQATVAELASLGQAMRAALLRRALSDLLT